MERTLTVRHRRIAEKHGETPVLGDMNLNPWQSCVISPRGGNTLGVDGRYEDELIQGWGFARKMRDKGIEVLERVVEMVHHRSLAK
jgi:hypothetical protein